MKLPLKLSNENDTYYNCKKPYSYGAEFIGIDGPRGPGKSTTFIIDALHQCEKGYQFIWLRRYKPEIKEIVHKDFLNEVLDGIVYKGDGNGGYHVIYGDIILGYLIPLVKYRDYKSTQFPKVNRIIFDEAFVRETIAYRYLQDETTSFWEMVSTVVRTRKNYKIILIGNNEDLFNPYYQFFNVPIFDKIWTDKKRRLYFEHVEPSEKFKELQKATPLHAMISGTAYGDYHYNNTNIKANKDIKVIKKPPNANLLFRLEINGKTLNCYTYNNTGVKMFIEYRDKIIDDNITYHLAKDNKPNYYYIDLYKHKLKSFVNKLYYGENVIYADSEIAGTLFQWVLSNI